MPPQIGLILTHAPDLAWLRAQIALAGASVLKVVPAWGLAGGWTPKSIVEASYLCPTLIVRTSWGDPSYDGGARAFPYVNQVLEEITPWGTARADLVVEIGNEPLVERHPLDQAQAWEYLAHLSAAIEAIRETFPQARIISPAHCRDHPIACGSEPDGQRWWDSIAAATYRRCDILGLHAYSAAQFLSGHLALRELVSASQPIWLTEFALHEAGLAGVARGERYADVLGALPVEVACIYHLDHADGPALAAQGPDAYRLEPATLRALHTPRPPLGAPGAPRLSDLGIIDSRPRLHVIAERVPRPRRGPPTTTTLHYNGPRVSCAGNPAAELRRVATIDVVDHQQRLNADSLQYHLVVLSNGSIHQTRDLDLPASHCGVAEGNQRSLAIHLPIGGTQDATAPQWTATTRLLDALAAAYAMPGGRRAHRLHSEWKTTLCPGPNLSRRLTAWRAEAATAGGLSRIRPDVAAANVREGPGVSFPVALQGRAVMWPGDTLDWDVIVEGEAVGGDARWLHRRDGLGFVHISVTVRV